MLYLVYCKNDNLDFYKGLCVGLFDVQSALKMMVCRLCYIQTEPCYSHSIPSLCSVLAIVSPIICFEANQHISHED